MSFWSLGVEIQSNLSLRLARTPTPSSSASKLDIVVDPSPSALLERVVRDRQIAYQHRENGTQVTLLAFDEWTRGVEFTRGDERVRFVHCHGTDRITYAHNQSVHHTDLAAIIEGPIIGWYLRLQKQPLLHAAAVRWNDQLLAISAEPGTGKSTLAALFCAHGAAHWSDDIVAYDPQQTTGLSDGRPRRLSREARNLQSDSDTLSEDLSTEIFTDSPKVFATPILELTDALQTPQSLGHVLILGPRIASDTPTFERLSGPRAAIALTHGRYPSWLRTPTADKEAFQNAAALAEKVPVTLAHMPQGLGALQRATPTLLAWCETQLGALTNRPV